MALKHTTKKVGDLSLPLDLGSLDKLQEVEEKFGDEKATVSIGFNTDIKTQIFNAADDKDEDGLYGNDEDSFIKPQEGKSYLKYRGEARIKLDSGLEINQIGFSIDSNHQIISGSYRLHDNTQLVGEAVTNDLKNFKSIFSEEQLKSLEIGEAVFMSFNGAMQGKIEASWSDMLSGTLSEIAGWLDNEALSIKMEASASASFYIKVEDAFKLMLKKVASTKYEISVAKNHAMSKGFTGSVGITVGFENPESVVGYSEKIMESLFNENKETITQIIQKDLLGSLSQSQRNTLNNIADRFGWDLDENLLEKLKEEYDKLSEKVVKKVNSLAEKSIKAGFSYDYKRISKQETLFKGILVGDKAIETFHKPMLFMQTNTLIDAYKSGTNLLESVSFLEKHVTEKSKSWGFSLGFGSFKAFDKTDESIKLVTSESEKGKQVAYEARKAFSNFLGANGSIHKVDFNASMDGLSLSEPLASALDYSLYLDFTYSEKKLNRPELNQFLDIARIWKAIPSGDFEEVGNKLNKELKNVKNIELKIELKFNSEAFQALVPVLSTLSNRTDLISLALGKSMLYWEKYELRKSPELRAQYYGQLWNFYFANPDEPRWFYAQKAKNVLKPVDKKLAKWEHLHKNDPASFYSFETALLQNPNTKNNWDSFSEGIKLLANGIKSSSTLTHEQVVPKAFKAMQKFWRHPLHLKALGVYLLQVADEYPMILENINRTASLTYKQEGKEQVIILS